MTDLGFVYCMSNPSMPGLLKIGKVSLTKKGYRTPNTRARELYDTGVPLPFIVEFVIKTYECEKLEKQIHKIYDKCRINAKREFFRISINEVEELFKSYIILGCSWWKEDDKALEENKEHEQIIQDSYNNTSIGCRNENRCFIDQQKIMYPLKNDNGENIEILGFYDKNTQQIICNDKSYKSLNTFVVEHNKIHRKNKNPSANAWLKCKCEINNKWISTYSLSEL
jgi:hypothetical protein